jgi:hypothetical protein
VGPWKPPHNLQNSSLDGDGKVRLTDIATFAVLYGQAPTAVPPDCFSENLPCPCGDLNRDRAVNLSDFATFAVCYGRNEAGPGCPAHTLHCADLNADGHVNLSDFATFAVWYGQEPSQVVPNCTQE